MEKNAPRKNQQIMSRNPGLDVMKGLLILLMVYCHFLQFFGSRTEYTVEQAWIDWINLVAFPAFLFVFGCTNQLAYLSKPFKQVGGRMALTFLKTLAAYYISGVAFQLLVGKLDFLPAAVNDVVFLRVLPGWSEFLAAFAAFALLAMVLFKPIKWLLAHPIPFWCVCALSLAATFLPYERFTSVPLGLLIGINKENSSFPVVQYMAYFLMGAYVARNGLGKRPWLWFAISAVSFAIGTAVMLQNGWPSRFPPALMWIVMPAFLVLALYAVCQRAGSGMKVSRVAELALRPVAFIGERTLFYLLVTNLFIFTMYGTDILPVIISSNSFPFNIPLDTPWGAAFWTLALVLIASLLASLASRRRK